MFLKGIKILTCFMLSCVILQAYECDGNPNGYNEGSGGCSEDDGDCGEDRPGTCLDGPDRDD